MDRKELTEYLKDQWREDFLDLGIEIYDLQYVHEDGNNILRLFIEKPEDLVSIEDCEKVSEYVSDSLDILDPIDSSYLLEVSSVGIDKPFERDRDYDRNIGKVVEATFYGTYQGHRMIKGTLLGYTEDEVEMTLRHENNRKVKIKKNQIADIRLSLFDN